MWKKDRNIFLLIVLLLLLVLLFSWATGRFRISAFLSQHFSQDQIQIKTVLSQGTGGNGGMRKENDDKRDESVAEKERKGKIALTFDDGPDPTHTPQLLEGLAKRGVKASFFITGKNAESYPELVRQMHEAGHLIGNHTYSHLQLNKKNREAFRAELVRTNEIIKEITGEEVVFVRPPYGSWDKSFEEELNMFPVLWTIDPLDWCSNDVACVINKVIPKVKENSIILMHDEYASTVTAALQIVDELQKQGYEFVTVDEILFD